ncbi:MAG: hypothetical protein IPL46_10205 [Saprospiraceae bacterium]|nr:hypothetical protein [Saprospiraceae bacterium]
MSVANLSYDPIKKEYLLDLRMFLDDFLVVTGALPENANPFGQMLASPTKNEVRTYLADHFKIYFNNDLVEQKVDKVKIEELTIHVTIIIKSSLDPEAIKSIKVLDTIYADEFINQRNIIHINLPGKSKKSLLFNRYEREEIASW